MNIYDHVFTSSQVAKAAGMESANFRAQFTRNNWRIIGKVRPGNGEAHLFTIYDALQYALARRLMKYGFEASRAFDLAWQNFSHVGDEDREPGGIYDTDKFGRTFFVASIDGAHAECLAQKNITDAIQFLIPGMGHRVPDAVIIDLVQLREEVFRALGLDSRDYE